jgi:glutaconate CoA-transferase subunit B
LGLARAEDLWLGKALMTIGFVTVAADVLPHVDPIEFFRPAQVDKQGNTNNVAIGQDYRHPRLRLPGAGGIPDASAFWSNIHLYVPRHSRAVFVSAVDFVSGLGHVPERRRGRGPVYLISNLGQFDWADGQMRLTHLHPGVTVERIQARTGFALAVAPDVHESPPPTAEEVRLLREEIDPLGLRKLETLGGAARKRLIRDILAQESVL